MASERKPLLPLTTGGAEYTDRLVKVISKAFVNDPLWKYFLNEKFNLAQGAPLSEQNCWDFFYSLAVKRQSSGAIFNEVGNWAGIAIW
jgi:hypothetical protein